MITVAESKDYPLLREIFTHEDVWWRIADGDPKGFEVPDWPIYLLARVDDKPAGIFVLHEAKDGTDSHIQILPEFRDLKYEIGAAVLKAAKKYTNRITTNIPKRFPNVHHYALKFGYEVLREDDENWYYQKEL